MTGESKSTIKLPPDFSKECDEGFQNFLTKLRKHCDGFFFDLVFLILLDATSVGLFASRNPRTYQGSTRGCNEEHPELFREVTMKRFFKN